MPSLLIFLLLFPLGALADARLELHTNTIHAPYDQADADNELELTDGDSEILAVALPGDRYNAQYTTVVLNVARGNVRGVDRNKVDTGGKDSVKTDCTVTQGVYEDRDENIYVTNNCLVRLTYSRTERRARYALLVEVYLWGLRAASTAEAAAAAYAGAAPHMR